MIHLLSECYGLGNFLSVEGGNILIENAATLPRHLREQIIQNKTELIAALNNDEEAKQSGLMIGRSGLLYTLTVSRHSSAYIEFIDGKWIAWRETYRPGNSTAISTKDIARGNTFGYVLAEFKKYTDYVTRKRSEWS